MAVKYGLTKEEQEELRAARAQKSDGGGTQEQSQNSRYDRTTNRMRYGLSEAEQQYFSKSRSDKRKAEIQQINQSAGWRTTAYTKARERTASAYDSYNSLVEDYQALFDNDKRLRADKADQETISALLKRAETMEKESQSGTRSGLKAMQESLRSIQARNMMQSVVPEAIPGLPGDRMKYHSAGQTAERAAKVQAGAAAIPGLPGERVDYRDVAKTGLEQKNGQDQEMTVEEAGQRYREIKERLNELNRSGRTYGVMEQGGVYTPEAEKERKELLEEQDQLSQYIRQMSMESAMRHDSSYWAKKASHEEDRLQEANAYRSGYGGVMQSGVVLDSEKTRRAEDIQREFDKAREYYYYTKNAEDWNRMTPELQEKAMEAAALDVNGVFDWQEGDALSRSGLSPDQRAAQSRENSDRLAQLRQEIRDAGFDADRILEYANRMRNQQKMQEETKSMAEFGTGSVAGGIAATAATYGANLLSGIGSVGLLAQRVFGSGKGITEYRPVDYNDPSAAFSQVTQQTRQAIGGQMGETGQFFYNALNSAVDSAARMLVGQAIGNGFLPDAVSQEAIDRMNRIVSGAVSAQMNAQVFTDAFISAKQNGATDDDAILDAIVQAAIEGITEKYSVDAILKNPKQLTWTALRNSFLAEGSEEIASDVLNTIYDELKNGSDSELRSEAQAYIDAGIGTEEAWKRVLGSYAKQLILDGLAGGLSGLAMGAASELSRIQEYKQYYRDAESGQALADKAQELKSENETDLAERGQIQEGKPKTVEQTVEERADALYREFGGMQETSPEGSKQKPQSAAQEAVTQAAQTFQAEQREMPGAAKTGQGTKGAAQAATARNAAQMTAKTGKAGTSVRGTDVVKAVKIGDNDIVIQKTDGSTASINTLDQRGTALEVLQFAKEMPDYRDTMTVNGMMRAYETYLGRTRGNRSVAERFFDNYVIAVAAGAEGESLADALGVTTDRKMQTAMESGWRRGVEIAKGRRISMEMGSAGQAAMEQYGYLYPQLFSDFYRAGQQGATFQQAMEAAGVKSLGEIKKTEMKAAWKAGRKDGTDYEVERYAVSDAGSQRENGLGAGGKAGSLEAGTGGSEGREGGRVGRRGGGDAENRTSLKKLGVKSGTDAPQEVVSREKNEHGGEIITVSDRLLVRGQDGTEREVQAIQSGNNVILRADDPMMEQHKAHELEHIRQRSMTDEEITAVFREKTKSLSDERLRRILSAYALDYYGLYGEDDTTMADLYREYLADEAAGITPKETKEAVRLPDERGTERDQRDGIRAMRGNQNGEKPAYTVNREYAAELNAWVRGGMPEGERFELGSTGPVLQGLGAIESDIYINGDKIKTILQIHPEMTIAEIKKIPEILEDPALVLKSKTKGKSIVIFGTYRAQNGKPILVAMDLRPMEKGFVLTDMQKVASAYTKTGTLNKTAEENERDFLQSSDVLFLDKKRAAAVLRPMGIYAPMDILRNGYIGSISYSGRYVNTEGVPFSSVVRERGESYSASAPELDSTGRELSTEQAEYFKDSKVRDEDGNLKPVYHGSGAKFTEFSHKFGGAHGSAEGQGFYFTDYKPMAEGYEEKGGQLLEGYLDIKKPLSDSELTLRRNEVTKLVKSIDPTGDDLVSNYDTSGMGYPSRAWYNRALRETVDMLMQNDTDSELMGEIANAFGDRESVLKAAREQLGYDGYIVDGKYDGATVYVAFDSSQFKNIENRKPTDNKDIRYSVSEEYEPVSSAEYAQTQRDSKQREALMEQSTKQTFELRRQFTEGTERDLSASDLPGIAADLRRIYGKKSMGQTELQERLEHIATVKAGERSPMEAYRRAKNEADILAADMIRNALGQTEEAADDWNGIKAAFRSGGKPVKLFIDGANRMDLEAEGGYEGMRKRLMGYAFLSSGGVPVDVFYQEELSSRFPGYFPASIQNPADQLIRIVSVIDQFRAIFRSPYAGGMAEDTEMLSQDILQRLYNSMTPSGNAAAFAEQHEDMVRAYYETKLQSTRDAWKKQVEQMKQSFADKQQEQRTAREERKLQEQLLHIAQRLDRVRVGSEWKSKAEELVGALDTAARSLTGKTIIGDYIGNVSSEGIETVRTNEKGQKVVTLDALREFVSRQQAENPDFLPDQKTMDKIKRLDKVQISDLTIGEIRNLLNAMQNLENEMRVSKKLIDAEDRRDVAIQAEEVRADISSSQGVSPTGVKKAWSNLITTQSLSPVRFLRRITGYKDNDPLYRAGQAMQDGETAMLDYQRRAEAKFRSFQENKPFMESLSGKKSKPVEITGRTDEGIQTVKITPDMRIAIYLHSKNGENVRHAERGGMVVPNYDLLMKGKAEEAYEQGTILYLTWSQMHAVGNGMTAMERNYANAIWEYFNTFSKDEINKVSRALLGYDIAVVRNYYPIEVNRKFTRAEPDAVKHDAKTESSGFLKSRTGAANTINLRGATETLERAMTQHAKYVGLAIPVRNFGKLYGNTSWSISPDPDDPREIQTVTSSVRDVLDRKWGSEAGRYIDKLMADIQNPVTSDGKWNRVFGKIRSNYAGAVLTLNLSVAMKQAASYPTAAAVVGWKPLAQAMTNWKTADLDRIAKYTPLLWYRSKGYSTKELGDLAKGNRSLPKALNWIQAIDVATTKKLWKAAEYYVRDNQKGLTIGSDDYYKAVANVYNRIILETQPNYTTMERPQLLRENDTLLQNLSMFKTQPMQNLNIAYDAIANLRAKERQLKAARDAAGNDPAAAERVKEAEQAVKEAKTDFGHSISALLVSGIVFSTMTLLWNLLRGKMNKYQDDDEETTALTFLKGFGGDLASSFAGMIPFGSDVYEMAWSLFTKDKYYGMEAVTPSAISDFLEAAVKIPDNFKDVKGAFEGDVPVGDVVWSVDQLLLAASKLFGVPAENVQNMGKIAYLTVLRGEKYAKLITAEEADYWYRYYTTKTSASKRRSKDYTDIYEAAKDGNTDGYKAMREKMEGWIWKENDSYQSGDISREEARERATETVNGAMQDRIQEEFLSGTMQEKEAKELLTEIAGFDKDDQRKLDETVLHWACERDTGIKYDDLKDAYLGGEISGKKAAQYLAKYGWNEADMEADEITEEAEATVQKWDYQEDSGNGKASASRADKYYEFAEPVGINISVFDEAYTFASNVEADKDKDGESISGSAKQKVVDYILGLGLSGEQERALWNAVKGNWSDKDTPWH